MEQTGDAMTVPIAASVASADAAAMSTSNGAGRRRAAALTFSRVLASSQELQDRLTRLSAVTTQIHDIVHRGNQSGATAPTFARAAGAGRNCACSAAVSGLRAAKVLSQVRQGSLPRRPSRRRRQQRPPQPWLRVSGTSLLYCLFYSGTSLFYPLFYSGTSQSHRHRRAFAVAVIAVVWSHLIASYARLVLALARGRSPTAEPACRRRNDADRFTGLPAFHPFTLLGARRSPAAGPYSRSRPCADFAGRA